MRHAFDGPHHLGRRHWRKFLELKFDHPGQFGGRTGRELDGAEKHRFRRHPGDVQTGADQQTPVPRDHIGRQGLVCGDLPLASRHRAALVDGKVVEVSLAISERQHIAGMGNGSGFAHSGMPP